jgi:hypothetical protein
MGCERSHYRAELLTIPCILYTHRTVVLYVDSLALEVDMDALSELSMTIVNQPVETGNSTVLGPVREIAEEGVIGGEGTLVWRKC